MADTTDKPDSNVDSTIKAVTGLVQAVPVYQDALQPAAKEVGKSLATVAKTVNIALAPIKALVWGYEQIEEFINKRVTEKLKNVPEENIVTPPPQIAGPAVEALRYAGHEENLRELYANLLATAMDKSTVKNAHPGYVEVLKNMHPDEATLLQAFTKNEDHPLIDIRGEVDEGWYTFYTNYSHIHKTLTFRNWQAIPTYIDNLCRLGILEIPPYMVLAGVNIYEPLENDSELEDLKSQIQGIGRKVTFGRKSVLLTSFGRQFVKNVIVDKG